MKYKSFSIKEAQNKLEKYCAYQERSHKEVVEKLKKINMASIDIDQIVGSLIQRNYLNENRFAKSFTRGKFKLKSWGKKRIKFELKHHNVSEYNIKDALDQIDDDEYIKVLNSLGEKIWKSSKGKDFYKRKARFISSLEYRGWERNLIFNQLDKIQTKKK